MVLGEEVVPRRLVEEEGPCQEADREMAVVHLRVVLVVDSLRPAEEVGQVLLNARRRQINPVSSLSMSNGDAKYVD